MATTLKPRQSAIPTPGKAGNRSTPSRSRASSSVGRYAAPTLDVDFVSRAFADAVSSNDPIHHRTSHVGEGPNGALSPTAPLSSGRQSVTGRPSSVASTSAAGSVVQRPRTPTSQRTPGRPSDAVGRSNSRNGRIFDIGDQVRIESLGFEGTLRFLGEIDGKVGIWAGVELSRGFAGKGKNDGSVNGKRYFVCPPYCGVFVSTVKLSMPTVSRAPIHRPPSAASSRSGRHTPSISGRPSYPAVPAGGSSTVMGISVGGRITPSQVPGGIAYSTTPTHNRIGAGARVSKSATDLSKQTQSVIPGSPKAPGRDVSSESMAGNTPAVDRSRILDMRELKSYLETPNGLHESTPKYRRTPHTIRARIPSAIAMPPPPTITTAVNRSSSASSESPTGGSEDPLRGRSRVSLASATSPLPSTSASFNDFHIIPGAKSVTRQVTGTGSTSNYGEGNDEHVRILAGKRVNGITEPFHDSGNLESDQNRILMTQISDLRAQLQHSEAILAERDSTAESLRQALLISEKQRTEDELRVRVLEQQVSTSTSFCDSLRETIKLKEERENESESILMGKDAKIVALEVQFKTLSVQSESEKKELSSHVEELRRAGQETIALYEERLNEAECKRFELEDRIILLETRQFPQNEAVSSELGTHIDSATQIDNESLRDHVRHLQKSIAALEDKLEEVQATSENEGIVLREKLKRSKEKEESMRRDLIQGKKDIDQALKSEASARLRLQEIEEALRENTNALEDARAEVERLRAELANVADNDKGHRTSDMIKSDSRSQIQRKPSGSSVQSSTFAHPHDAIRVLEARNGEVSAAKPAEGRRLELVQERHIPTESPRTSADRSGEQDSIRLADTTVSSTCQPSSRMASNATQGLLLRSEEALVRDEITGLKFIVHELQQENSVANEKIKVLEAANELLRSESEQLRQEIKILEDGFEQSILREEQAISELSRPPSPTDDVKKLQVSLTQQKTQYQLELDQLRKKLADAEMKNARLTLESNKEISELETLVESKIYRENELEVELERAKTTLAQFHRQLSKDVSVTRHSQTSFRHTSTTSQDVCEICEKPGHDIFTCNLLKEGPTGVPNDHTFRNNSHQIPRDGGVEGDLFCEDCESHGHTSIDCPHSLDIF